MNWFGDDVVAIVSSFSDSLQEIPYRISYKASRFKKDAGKKVFSCSCPAGSYRGTCKHLQAVRNNSLAELTQDDRFTISDYGKNVLK